MKQNLLQRFLATLMLIAVSTLSWAYDFEKDGIFYNINPDRTSVTVTYKTTSYNSYPCSFDIPSKVTYGTATFNVTSIGEHAFRESSGLTSITIPNSVTSIGNRAFYRCNGLTSVTIPNSVTSIGNYAFSGCSALTSMTIGKSVTSIGYNAFARCSGLTSITIPNSVTSIGNYAFMDCSGLTSVTIPNSVTSIGNYAFKDCSGLTKAEFASIESLCKISFGAYEANPLTYAKHLYINGQEITDLVVPNSVTSIGDRAFYGCAGLTSITIPNSVTSIGIYAFDGTTWYNNKPDGLVYAGKVAYKYKGTMPSGTNISLKAGTLGVAVSAFSDCTNLTSVIIPNSVTNIGDEAFKNCSGLTSLSIGNSVVSIGSSVFYGCSGLTSVTIPNSVTSIGDEAFYRCSGLTSVIIPNSVTNIGELAFCNCTGLISVTIGSNITEIGYAAFGLLKKLQDVYCLAEQVPTTSTYAFDNSSHSNATLHVPASVVDAYKETAPWREFGTILAIGEVVPTNYNITATANPSNGGSITGGGTYQDGATVTLTATPAKGYEFEKWTENGTTVSTQAAYTFTATKNRSLVANFKVANPKIQFADAAVKAICVTNWDTNGDGELSETEAAQVTDLGTVFKSNKTITSFDELQYFTGLTDIGEWAFCYCSGLTFVTIPNSVTSIGNDTFRNCI